MTEQNDFAARYAELQTKAGAVNHQVRVVVFPGAAVRPGDAFTVKPIEADAMDLAGAIAWAEGYVASPEAAQRGELYRDLEAKKHEYLTLLGDMNNARNAWKAAEEAIAKDIDRALYPDDQLEDDDVETNVGPDQQDTAHQLAQEHAQRVADDAAGG